MANDEGPIVKKLTSSKMNICFNLVHRRQTVLFFLSAIKILGSTYFRLAESLTLKPLFAPDKEIVIK